MSALESSGELEQVVSERTKAHDAAKAAYGANPKASKLWDALDAARGAKERAELDLQLAIVRETAERHAAAERDRAERRAAFDSLAKSATADYFDAVKPIVAAVVEALAKVDAKIAKLDSLTDAQRRQAEHAATLAAEFGVRAPAPLNDAERDLLLRVAASRASAGALVARVLESPGARRFRRTLSEHAGGPAVREAIERSIAEQQLSPASTGIRDLDRNATTRPAWDSTDLPAWQQAARAMGLEPAS